MMNEPVDKNLAWFFDEVYGFYSFLKHTANEYGDDLDENKILDIMYKSSEFYEKNHDKYKTPKQVAFQFMKKTFKSSKKLMALYNKYSHAKAEIEKEELNNAISTK